MVQLDLVEQGVEAVIVRPRRPENIPDDLVPLVVLRATSGETSAGTALNPSEGEAMQLANEGLHAMRAERRQQK